MIFATIKTTSETKNKKQNEGRREETPMMLAKYFSKGSFELFRYFRTLTKQNWTR